MCGFILKAGEDITRTVLVATVNVTIIFAIFFPFSRRIYSVTSKLCTFCVKRSVLTVQLDIVGKTFFVAAILTRLNELNAF